MNRLLLRRCAAQHGQRRLLILLFARELGCCQANVSKHLKAIRWVWQESAQQDFGARKSKELARQDEVERGAWDAWTRSKRKSDGNPKFLQVVLGCIAKRCKILGLDSPKTIKLEEVDRITDRFADLIMEMFPTKEQQEWALARLSGAAPKKDMIH